MRLFDGPATFEGYFDFRAYLEHLLGRRVDLVTEKGLKPRARRYVEKDLIRVRSWTLGTIVMP